MGSISIWQLLIIAVIVVLLLSSKKLGSIGYDLGASIKGFKKAIGDDENKQEKKPIQDTNLMAKSVPDRQDDVKRATSKCRDKD